MKLRFSSTIFLLYCNFVQNATKDHHLEYGDANYSFNLRIGELWATNG